LRWCELAGGGAVSIERVGAERDGDRDLGSKRACGANELKSEVVCFPSLLTYRIAIAIASIAFAIICYVAHAAEQIAYHSTPL
jgi:hypothetical protein